MKTFDKCTIRIIELLLSLFGKRKRDRVLASISYELAPVININLPNENIKVACVSKKTLYWTKNFLEHEKETIEWINGFEGGDVFWDIGANVGIYSLYASQCTGVSVLAFEPVAQNYAALQRNVFLNNKQETIKYFCLGFSSGKTIPAIYLSNEQAGHDSHVFSETLLSDSKGKIFQPLLSISVDEFIDEYNPAFPNHIKLDVDGPELEILNGALNCLHDDRLLSLMVEGDTEKTGRTSEIFSVLKNAGFCHYETGATANSLVHCNYYFRK